jgi:4'-phosphopantetheinyl transferase
MVLRSEELHVWRAFMDVPASRVQRLKQILSEDELRRAERLYFRKDADYFIVVRGLLRMILGRYLNTEPSQLRFCYGPYGKPALVKECGGDGLRFNLSHSHGLALYAVTHGSMIGVDVERLRPVVAVAQIAERFFSPSETATLRGLPAAMQTEAFFTCWTRKEAYIKAKGKGLALALDQFEVSLAPEEPAALLNTKWDPQEANRWVLQELHPGPGYLAAVAIEGQQKHLECWQWPDY